MNKKTKTMKLLLILDAILFATSLITHMRLALYMGWIATLIIFIVLAFEPLDISERVLFAKIKDDAVAPIRGSSKAAGYDLSACIDKPIVIKPHETVKIGTGLSICPPKNHFGALFPRSGLSTKQGLRLANCVGVCDEDYTGEYIVPIHNDGNEEKIINPNDKIAQLIFLPYMSIKFTKVKKLKKTERGEGGFGSTGI